MDRRHFLRLSGLAASGALLLKQAGADAQPHDPAAHGGAPDASSAHGGEAPSTGAGAAPSAPRPLGPAPVAAPGGQVAVVTPNGWTLPWRLVDGVKVGHLVAEVVDHTFAPGLRAECWGYNGGTPGPTLEAVEGDRLRIYITNRLPEPTTLHWHGLPVACGMDGVSGLTQRPIPPGETFRYELSMTRPGTFMYHPHFDEMTQMALGMVGMFVVHPRSPRGPRVHRDFALLTHEWKLRVGTRRPDPLAMNDFNVLTFNSRSYPGTAPLVVGRGERVRIRLGNLSAMDHHPIHLHGHSFRLTATDGGEVPESARLPETTILVPVGTTRTIEFVADNPGDWAMHCHMTHHVMMQMGHDLPVTVGADGARIDRAVQPLLPDYMTMGHTGMGEMGEMQMPIPPNSLPMRGGAGALRRDRHGRHVYDPQGARPSHRGRWRLVHPPTRHGRCGGHRCRAAPRRDRPWAGEPLPGCTEAVSVASVRCLVAPRPA